MLFKWGNPMKPDTVWRDFMASVVVFLVALPLCLGIAIASGAPPMLGLVTGIIGGIVVGGIAGAPLQVSGPAAGMVAIVYEIIIAHGLPGLGVIVLLAGLLQVAAGTLRLGQWFRAISPAVIQGMLAGIGILIVASQFHVMLDVAPESSGLANLLSIPDTIRKGLFPIDDSSHHIAAMLGVAGISIILAWNTLPEKLQSLKSIPGTLVAVVAAVIVCALFQLPVKYVDIPAEILNTLTLPGPQTLPMLSDPAIWIMAATVAIVASAETMLSASALEHMQAQRQAKLEAQNLTCSNPRTRYDREMIAQGVGNSLCGLLGALPMTGVIVRSSANIQAGGQTRMATMLHGAWLLALVTFFPFMLERVPTAILAAVLVYTGYKLVQPAAIRKLAQAGWGEVAIYAVTVILVVSTNLLEGVIVGTVLAVLRLLFQLSRLEGRSVQGEGNRIELVLHGSATFLSLPQLASIMERQPLGRDLHVHVENLAHIDHACLELLQNWQQQYARSGGHITVEWHRLTEKLAGGMIQEPVHHTRLANIPGGPNMH